MLMRRFRPPIHEGDFGAQQHAHKLIDDKPHQWPHAVFIFGAHHEIERDWRRMVHEIGDLEIAAGDVLGDKRIAVERQERHGGREHRAPLFIRPVQHIARGARNGGVGFDAGAPPWPQPFTIIS